MNKAMILHQWISVMGDTNIMMHNKVLIVRQLWLANGVFSPRMSPAGKIMCVQA